ncbi:uncharacterized protein BO72DRAFT_129276 [Aspergillus fijiensis CBS 313.89]|uniref:Uncharacterized protein n=1 Tax=Aspergillus fijiensis CBS 313.89 TaxID=1448319 RepID=A0A8G1VYJ4_9EURO|nr:uncharacterized protein BO72DRAFT_129276 [Aspergillus fijiensis CBS 313.89]RAK76503.1 hypothetical protein BO72DRAFT_129276 [Aspergillus fijiensis CBS 313.89]
MLEIVASLNENTHIHTHASINPHHLLPPSTNTPTYAQPPSTISIQDMSPIPIPIPTSIRSSPQSSRPTAPDRTAPQMTSLIVQTSSTPNSCALPPSRNAMRRRRCIGWIFTLTMMLLGRGSGRPSCWASCWLGSWRRGWNPGLGRSKREEEGGELVDCVSLGLCRSRLLRENEKRRGEWRPGWR